MELEGLTTAAMGECPARSVRHECSLVDRSMVCVIALITKLCFIASQIEAQVSNAALIAAAEEHERAQAADLEAAKLRSERSTFAESLAREKAALEEVGRRVAALRGERERAAAAAEASTRLRLKRQDLAVSKLHIRLL